MPKLIRVRMVGAGTPGDPFRVPLPTYSKLIRDDETTLGAGAPRWAIVEIPDADYEPPADGEAETTVNVAGIGVVVRGLVATHRDRFRQKLRRKYRENAASYDVDPT